MTTEDATPLQHTENLNIVGDPKSPIVVVCDAPTQRVFDEGKVMTDAQMNLFFHHARANRFNKDEFVFMTPCPPVPESVLGSQKRENIFMGTYTTEFDTALRSFADAKLIIYLGPKAGRQITRRPVKITKARGQVKDQGYQAPCLAMLSPANVLTRPEVTETFATDFQIASMIADAGWDSSILDQSATKCEYEYCLDLSGWLVDPPKSIGLDLESAGGQWYYPTCRILTVQLSRAEGKSIVIPLDVDWYNQDEDWFNSVDPPAPMLTYRNRAMLRNQLKELLGNPAVAVTGSNLSGDLHKLRKIGVEVADWRHETQQLAFLEDENTFEKGLDESVRRWVQPMAGYADCVVPETLVLTSDMRKVRAGDLQIGDELCAFSCDTDGRKAARRIMKKSVVLETQKLRKLCFKIVTESGRSLIVSGGHLMMCKRGLSDRGGGWRWRCADKLTVGSVLKPFAWDDQVTTFDAGYVSGVIDGEGWICRGRSRLGISQKGNVVLRKFVEIVAREDIPWVHSIDKRKDVNNITFDGHSCFRMLQKFRPQRLLDDAAWEGSGLPTNGHCYDPVVSIESMGLMDVVGLRTSTETLIAEGLLSHNSFNRTVDKDHMERVKPADLLDYAGGDPDASRRLTRVLVKKGRADTRQWNCYQRVQMPALRTFNWMEEVGLRIDKQALRELGVVLDNKAKKLYDELIVQVPASIKRLHAEDGLKFSRPEFLIDILFAHPDGLKLTPTVFTKGTKNLTNPAERKPSTSKKDHLPYFKHIPFVATLIEQKTLAKMRSTYVGEEGGKLIPQRRKNVPPKYTEPTGFWQYISEDGRIHPAFFLHRTVTGRTSSAYPNAQNFPKRGDLAKAFRKIFIPTPGYVFIEADESQAELRVAAWMAQETNMLRIYREGGDIHEATAAAIMGMRVDAFRLWKDSDAPLSAKLKASLNVRIETYGDLYDLKRYQAKSVNFGFIFGMGWRKFKTYAKTDYGLDFTDAEAQNFRQIFFRLYPKLEDWHKQMREFVNDHGYVRSLHGALRHLPNINSGDEIVRGECERQGINSPVQRFASDIALMGMIRFGRDADWEIMRPVAFIHDNVIAEVKIGYEAEAMSALKFYMESPPLKEWFGLNSPVPIVSDVSMTRTNLAEMKEQKTIRPIVPEWYRADLDLAA